MAYSSPRTWSSGEIVTAAMLNQDVRDNQLAAFPLGVGAWTTYTPTLTQNAVAVTKTSTGSAYQRVGRLIAGTFSMSATGAGTISTAVAAGLPVAAAGAANLVIGQGYIYDSSANTFYGAILRLSTSATVTFQPTSTDSTSGGILGVAVFTAALASGDLIIGSYMFEAAS